MTEQRRQTVRIANHEPVRARIWGYGIVTVAGLAGVSIEIVRRAVRRGLLDMSDVLAVAEWIRKRTSAHTKLAIAKRAGCCPDTVADAVKRGDLALDDLASIDRWVHAFANQSSKPSPPGAFHWHSLLRSNADFHRTARKRSAGDVVELVNSLKAVGFKTAQRRGKHHIFIKPDLFCFADAARLRDLMNANGWTARQIDASARRWLAVFGAIGRPESLARLTRSKRYRGGLDAS